MTGQQQLIALMISNGVALLLLLAAWKRPNVARILFALLFIAAAFVNWQTARIDPAAYLTYADNAVPFYKRIILGPFSKHIVGYVSCIAIGQLLIGLSFLSRDIIFRLSAIGAILFFLAITPLGWGSAFPFPIIAGIACFLLARQPFEKNVFNNRWWV